MPDTTNKSGRIAGEDDIAGLPVDPGSDRPGEETLPASVWKNCESIIAENKKMLTRLKNVNWENLKDEDEEKLYKNCKKLLTYCLTYATPSGFTEKQLIKIGNSCHDVIKFLNDIKYVENAWAVNAEAHWKDIVASCKKGTFYSGGIIDPNYIHQVFQDQIKGLSISYNSGDNTDKKYADEFEEKLDDIIYKKDIKNRSKNVKGNECRLKGKVNLPAGYLSVLESPSSAAKTIATIPKGTKNLYITKKTEKGDYLYVANYGGWVNAKYVDITNRITTVAEMKDEKKEEKQKKKEREKKKKAKAENKQIEDYLYGLDTETGKVKKKKKRGDTSATVVDGWKTDDVAIKRTISIWGMPYQFLPSVDRRVIENEGVNPEGGWTGYGQTYTKRIISRMPLLLISPGRVNFTRDYMEKEDAAKALTSLLTGAKDLITDLTDSINHNTRYYTFEMDEVDYYSCVNTMISSGAKFMELDKVKVHLGSEDKKLGSVDWLNVAKSDSKGDKGMFKSILSSRPYVSFYIDSTNQISESFSNDTTESMLSSAVNQASSVGREISFLLGASTGKVPKFWDQSEVDNTMARVEEIGDKYLKGNQLFKDIGNQFATIAVGGKLIFPEIWADSSFTKSYNINIKLRTPDGDKLSWFLNIYVPLCHLICLTAPIQSEHGVNGIVSPFLVKAFYRGLFNVEMGIVTSLNITKGKEGAWTIDGLPTEVDVDMEIKDLYTLMSINKEKDAGAIVNNICLMDYIANTVGININEPDIFRQLDMYIMLKMNKYKHVIPNLWATIQQDAYNKINDYYTKMSKFLV